MRKIALPEEGIETLYGAHDANLRHIESLLSVQIRTQGSELTVRATQTMSSARSSFSASWARSSARVIPSPTAT